MLENYRASDCEGHFGIMMEIHKTIIRRFYCKKYSFHRYNELGSRISFILMILCAITVKIGLAANETSEGLPSYLSQDFSEKATIAILAAVLAFIGSFLLSEINKRRQPKKQLSYDIAIRKGILEIEKGIKDKITILYKNNIVENPFHAACNIKNTGNKTIKNQYIRFEFPKGTKIIDSYLDPDPEPEMGVAEAIEAQVLENEIRYKIGHLESLQQIGFRFILTGNNDVQMLLHPFNDTEEDVDFVHRAKILISDEMWQITKAIYLLLLFFILPAVFEPLGSLITLLVRGFILIQLLPILKPFSKVVANAILIFISERKDDSRIRDINIQDSTLKDVIVKT